MAPIVMDGPMITPWPMVLPLVISVLVAISVILLVVLCGCGAGKKKGGGEYVSFDFRSPYFCEECGMRAWESVYPKEPNPMLDPNWEENKKELMARRAEDYSMRLHYFDHGPGTAYKAPTADDTMRMKDEYQSIMEQNKSAMTLMVGPRKKKETEGSTPSTGSGSGSGGDSGPGGGKSIRKSGGKSAEKSSRQGSGGSDTGGGGGAFGKDHDPTAFKSARNPAYGTLYEAKSNVFDRNRGKKATGSSVVPKGAPAQTVMHGDEQMRAAQANPAYQTLYAAKTGVFDKGRAPQTSMAGGQLPDQTRMAAAAKDPTYQTLYAAKSGVFDKKAGGGGGVSLKATSQLVVN